MNTYFCVVRRANPLPLDPVPGHSEPIELRIQVLAAGFYQAIEFALETARRCDQRVAWQILSVQQN